MRKVFLFAAQMALCLPVVASVRPINLDPNNLSSLTQRVLTRREIQTAVQQMSLANAQSLVERYYETVEPAQIIVAAGIDLDEERLAGLRQLGLQPTDIQPGSTFQVNAVLITRQIWNQTARINSMMSAPALTTVLADSSSGRQTGNQETQPASSTTRHSSVATRQEERPDARPRPDTAESLSGGLTEEEVTQHYREVSEHEILERRRNEIEVRDGADLSNIVVYFEGRYMRFNDFLQQHGIRIDENEYTEWADNPWLGPIRIRSRRLVSERGQSDVAYLLNQLRFFQKK